MFDRKGHVAKLCLIFLPLLVASLVAVSRVDDYWHHWQDVFGGALIGLLMYHFLFFFLPLLTVLEFTNKLLTMSFLHFLLLPLFYAGITVATFCYLQFFPPPYDVDGMALISFNLYCILFYLVL